MPDIYFTTDPEANTLLAEDPYALIVGLTLYQQVPTEKAFEGPHVLQQRLGGTLDVKRIAEMDPDELETVFRERPAIHRFPANMAKRVQAVSQYLMDECGGEASALWANAASGDELLANLMAVPGFGEYKARVTIGVLARRFGIRPTGYEEHMPDWPSIADIEAPEDLEDLKVRKKVWKESKSAD
jgi:uncharacterized HhH-GPD family protein